MTIFKTRYQAKKALDNKKQYKSAFKVIKYKEGFIVACGLLFI